jgi:pyruvate ferredoxin oxidoreductase alpha subunit
MKSTLLDGNAAAAWGGRLARAQVVPNFPVTPQTELIEKFAEWKSKGEWRGEFLPVESEHSVLSAAIAASATGARVFSGSSSQGLMLMHEMVYVASGMRVPVIMINVSRALSAPITLWADHNDILDQRDSGWLMFFCESNQEVLDTVIQAYRICEDGRVLLPAFVNMEGFVLSYTREPTQIPEQKSVDAFLPKFRPKVLLDPKKPMAAGVGVMKEYPYFRSQVYLAQKNALGVIQEAHGEWEKRFGRRYGFVEEFMMEGAQACLVAMGSNSSIAKAAVKGLRSKGLPIGLLRIRVYRPFPREDIRKALAGVEAVGVIDQNLSPGYGGIVCPEIRDCLYDRKIPVSDFIMGLGGRQVSQQDFEQAGMEVLKSVSTKKEVVMWQDVV